MRIAVVISFILFSVQATLAGTTVLPDKADSVTQTYMQAFTELESMLGSPEKACFKKAVFVTENAYLDNQIDYASFCREIDRYVSVCKAYRQANRLMYKKADSLNVNTNAAIFKFMTDTVWAAGRKPVHFPFTYDFDDYQGQADWSRMFVTKLMLTGSGNCHSLPFLYRILAEELGAKAWLSLAPGHIFIKNHCIESGWYNTELTSRMFPVDAWVAASGYVTLAAMQNGIYLDTLGMNQSIVFCLFDLAKGYERRLPVNDGTFILSCCDLAIKHFPIFINAMLLKAETLRKQLDQIRISKKAPDIKSVLNDPVAKQKYDEMEKLYATILKLGYREMPEKMYRQWLLSLKENKEKYQNQKIMSNFNPR